MDVGTEDCGYSWLYLLDENVESVLNVSQRRADHLSAMLLVKQLPLSTNGFFTDSR